MDDQTQMISQNQIVLPYYNVVTDTSGWQFGITKLSGTGKIRSPRMQGKNPLSVLVLLDDGTVKLYTDPMYLKSTETAPSFPYWGWVDIEHEGEILKARLTAPKRVQGSTELKILISHNRTSIFTKYGLEQVGLEETINDLPYNITLDIKNQSEPIVEVPINLGSTTLGFMTVDEGRVIKITPSKFSMQNRLWTSHLVRAIHINYN